MRNKCLPSTSRMVKEGIEIKLTNYSVLLYMLSENMEGGRALAQCTDLFV